MTHSIESSFGKRHLVKKLMKNLGDHLSLIEWKAHSIDKLPREKNS